jgi:multiple sugar transport system substrate-binding protein
VSGRIRRFAPVALAAALLAPAPAVLGVSPDPSAPVASGPVSFMVFGDPGEIAAYQTLVDAFKATRPEIDVELITVPDQGDYRQRLGADLAAGSPADVVLINHRNQAAFSAKGQLEPLSARLRASSLVDAADFYPQATAGFTWKGELMCIPQNISSLVVYYDRDLFDAAGLAYPEAGWTWDDFLATAQALTKDLDGDGVTDQYGLGVEPQLIRLAPFVWQNGGEIVNNPLEPRSLGLDSARATEALQWFVDLQVAHHVVPDAVAEQAEDSESRFLNGRTAMVLQSRRIVPTVREVPFDWDVAPLPQREEAASVLHSDGYCMPSAAAHKDAAWALIEFANSPEGQTVIAGTGRTVPSLEAVSMSAAFLDPSTQPASSQVWLDAIPSIHTLPLLPGWADIEEIANQELERAFYGRATVQEAIRAMVDRTKPFFAGAEG